MNSRFLKYTLVIISIISFSQAESEVTPKMSLLSCSKLLDHKFKERPAPELLSKLMLSCFITISNNQAQKIFHWEEKNSFPLESQEIEELIDLNNLNSIPEEELKIKSDSMNKLIEETTNQKNNLRRLVDIDDNDNAEDKQDKDTKDNIDIKDDDNDDNDDNKDNNNDDEDILM